MASRGRQVVVDRRTASARGSMMNEVKRVFTSGPGVLLLVAINMMSINSLSPATAKGLFIVFASVELISMLSLWRLDRLPWQR